MTRVIYRIDNTLTHDFYVGKTERDISCRFREHQTISLRGSPSHLHRAMRKYGIDNFECSVIEHLRENVDISERERYWIAALTPHYNMTEGGEGSSGRVTSEETKSKISKSLTGKPLTAETVAKIAKGNRGKVRTEEAKRNYSIAGKKRPPFSEETRRKMSESAKRRSTENTGAALRQYWASPEGRNRLSYRNQKIKEAWVKKVAENKI